MSLGTASITIDPDTSRVIITGEILASLEELVDARLKTDAGQRALPLDPADLLAQRAVALQEAGRWLNVLSECDRALRDGDFSLECNGVSMQAAELASEDCDPADVAEKIR